MKVISFESLNRLANNAKKYNGQIDQAQLHACFVAQVIGYMRAYDPVEANCLALTLGMPHLVEGVDPYLGEF